MTSIRGISGDKSVKLEERIAEGDSYSALQTYKTMYARSLKKGEWQVAVDLCRSGCVASLKHQHVAAGSELAGLLVTALVESNVEQTDELNAILVEVLEAFEAVNDTDERYKQLTRVLKAIISWSSVSNGGRYEKGDPQFHLLLAEAKVKSGDMSGASTHYLHAHRPAEHAQFIYDWSCHGYAKERDMFITRPVLQLLALENLKDANILFETFVTIADSQKEKFPRSPLINFLEYLLQTLEKDAYPLFQMLRDKYAVALRRDQSFNMYLDRIQEKFFGVKPQKHGFQAMMDNMLGMFGN